ncbi:four-helix bundle copper-binding protein [Flaviflagellibacter deserti]|uniref:Four-helix bundle copper-binding protein n=1 Tax=Flaviflagellibacter deserti TaxID=2267266 RepID=A0ABV9Z495_9HYPH
MHTQQMIATHPHVQGSTNDALIRAIDIAADCALICTSCADACLGEPMAAELTQCIRLDLDCADVCATTASVATRRTGSNEALIKSMLEVCSEACRVCGEECARHADHHEHCRICADTCRQCEQACREAAASISPGRSAQH